MLSLKIVLIFLELISEPQVVLSMRPETEVAVGEAGGERRLLAGEALVEASALDHVGRTRRGERRSRGECKKGSAKQELK